jgi:hypothetical protein
LYDAVLSADKAPTAVADEEMEKFMPMLNEYLKRRSFGSREYNYSKFPVNDISASASVSSVAETLPPSESLSSSTDDYVWDVFYHRPVTLTEWNEAANVGTLYVQLYI